MNFLLTASIADDDYDCNNAFWLMSFMLDKETLTEQ